MLIIGGLATLGEGVLVGVGAGGYALYNRNKNKGNQEDPNNNYY